MTDTTPKSEASNFWDLQRSCYELDYLPARHSSWQDLKEELFPDGEELRDPQGNTSFMVALWSNKVDAASVLFELGSNPSSVNSRGLCVFQSSIRDLSKRPGGVERLVEMIDKFPHQWPRPTDAERFDEILDSWVGALMSMDRSRLGSPQAVGRLLDYVFTPLSYDEARALSRRHDCRENSVGASIEWKSRVAEKAAMALRSVAGRTLEEATSTLPRM